MTPADLIHAEIGRRITGIGDPTSDVREDYDCEAVGVAPWDDSRCYECKVVAKLLQGRWVGWLYWYGGGKHGEPESIDWIDDAVFLEETSPKTIRTFKVSP